MIRRLLASPLPASPLLFLALIGAGCEPSQPAAGPRGRGSVSAETTNFPSREAIAKIAAAPVPARLFDDRGKDVPSWELEGPLPDALDATPSQDDSPWGKLLAESEPVKGGAVLTTEAMRCVARQYAAFYLANEAIPAEALAHFIAARCGAPTGQVGAAAQGVKGDDRIPEQQVFDQFRAPVKALIDKTLAGGHVEAGVGYARKNGHAVITLAFTPRTVRVERTPFVPGPDGKIVVRGEVTAPAGTLRALVNRGRYGYAVCAADPAVALPRFSVTCDTSREDEVAWLTISTLPPGRLLGTPVLELLAWPSGAPGKVYAKIARPAAQTPAPAEVASLPELVEEINRVRKDAGLSPVTLADRESATATRLAPHFFSSFSAGDTSSDQVALGLLAGWEVEGMVRNGHFVSVVTPGAAYRDLIQSALSRPVGREALLDPAAVRVSIGAITEGGNVGALLSTYSLFDGYKHDLNEGRAIAARLAGLRRARAVREPTLVTELSAACQHAAISVQEGRRTAEEALDDLVRFVNEKLGRSARAWASETTALEQMKLPEELLSSPVLMFGVGVGHHKPAGRAWGRFLVYFVAVEDAGSVMTASRGGGNAG